MPTALRNAFIYTGAVDHRCIPDGAIVIENGSIVWIGSNRDLPGPFQEGARDLGGRVVMPGMINTHAHGGLTVRRGYVDDGDLFEWAAALAPHTSALTIRSEEHTSEP